MSPLPRSADHAGRGGWRELPPGPHRALLHQRRADLRALRPGAPLDGAAAPGGAQGARTAGARPHRAEAGAPGGDRHRPTPGGGAIQRTPS
eukprot:702660-Prorocentrum_minimum.AAC.1